MSDTIPVPVRGLDTSPADGVRSGGRDPERVQKYADQVRKSPDALPPVRVFAARAGKSWRYYLADGGYRLAARRLADPKLLTVMADLTQCVSAEDAERKAWAWACRANDDHGAGRTHEDIRCVVLAALKRPEIEGFSNRQIAAYCGVSHTFVNRVRSASPAPTSGNVSTGQVGPESEPLENVESSRTDDAGDSEPAAAEPNAGLERVPPLDRPHPLDAPPRPDVPAVSVPPGVLAAKGRGVFLDARARLDMARKAIVACFESGAAGGHLRRALAHTERGEGLPGVVYGLDRWSEILSDCTPDDEPCAWCHGEGVRRDAPGAAAGLAPDCQPCGGSGYSSEYNRARVFGENQARRLDGFDEVA